MRIYRERIPEVARKLVGALVDAELIEVDAEMAEEAELDVASVLTEYRRADYELTERARDIVTLRKLDYSSLHRIKSRLAQQARFGLGEEAIDWMSTQITEILLQSSHVEEVYGADHDLRRVITPILKRELGVESELDREVKKRIRNLQEGTEDYEIEYQKQIEKLRRAKRIGT